MKSIVIPPLLSDSYKQFHAPMYPDNMVKLYSNMTPRKSRLSTDRALWFGMQYYNKAYLIDYWNEEFFQKPWDHINKEIKRFHKNFSFVDDYDTSRWKELHELGYMPLKIKALPEGTLVDMRVPFFTITNTDKRFGWLVNFLETQMSTVIWDLVTVATISFEYKKLLEGWAIFTTNSKEGVQWQGHDFAMRGRSSIETCYNQAAHLLSFTGTDTIPAVYFLEKFYNANMEKELIASSVPATEHSVMTSYGKEDEIHAFERLLTLFPKGILSVVSDSFDLWKVCTTFLPQLKDQIMARDGKLVIRPDSGDPVDIICGTGVRTKFESVDEMELYTPTPQEKGVIRLLWEAFGGTTVIGSNGKKYKVLDPHIGAIYGDSITLERADQICKKLESMGFATTCIVLGIGSYTFNYQTRDTLGIAVKSTYCEIAHPTKVSTHYDLRRPVNMSGVDFTPIRVDMGPDGAFVIEGREIFKDPITDDGTKKSAKGLLAVFNDGKKLFLQDQVNWDMEESGELATVFLDGKLIVDHTLAEIRARVNSY